MRTLIYALSSGGPAAQYVVRQLELLAPHYEHVVVVGDSASLKGLNPTTIANCHTITTDGDLGDWAKWRAGLESLTWPELSQGSLTLLNDAALGPTNQYGEFLESLDTGDSDYWTFSKTGAPFFFQFNQKVVSSAAFRAFWKSDPPTSATAHTLQQHLSRALATAGFESGDAILIDPLASTVGMADPSAPRPDLWAQAGAPFLLIDHILERPDYAPYALEHLAAGGFPAEVASARLSQLTAPDAPQFLWAKQRDYANLAPLGELNNPPKVAIHVHAHFPKMLPDFLDVFATYDFPFQLFLTTGDDKVASVTEIVEPYGFDFEVTSVPNLGRDVYPLVLLRDKLAKFDVIGHFHTKKSGHDREFVGASWLHELFDMLLTPGNAIVADFARRPELGLVIADIPTFFRLNRIIFPDGEAPTIPLMQKLWDQMGLDPEFNFADRHTFVMSYGTFFWARPQAIMPLLEIPDLAELLPAEPVADNHTILHALERMFVYVAWAQGYDFAISQGRYLTSFADAPEPYLGQISTRSFLWQRFSSRIPEPIKARIRPALPAKKGTK